MLDFAEPADLIWRSYQTNGDPGSGVHQPVKTDIQGWGGTVEDSFKILKSGVLDNDLTTPPGAPTDGDKYIVPAAATGAWSGQAKKIALYESGAWVFFTPNSGWMSWVDDETAIFIYDGANWQRLVGLGDLAGLASLAYQNTVGTDDIDDAAVTLAKLQTVTAGAFLRGNATTGVLEEVSTLSDPRKTVLALGNHPDKIAGRAHIAWIGADGAVYAIGSGTNAANGQSGGFFLYWPKRVFVPPSGTTVSKLVTGHQSNYIILDNGHVYAWGNNTVGQLGLGDTVNRSKPTRIEFFVTNSKIIVDVIPERACRYATGYTLYLTDTGEVWGAGSNARGQLGDGTTTDRSTPVQAGSLTGVTSISAAPSVRGHVLAVVTGQLYSWGANESGQLGDGTTVDKSSPTLITGLTTVSKVHAISSYNGSSYRGSSFIVLDDGTARSAGNNQYGQLGLGDTTIRSSFVQISGLTNISKVVCSSGYYGSAASLDTTGNVKTWGYNGHGQLGLGNTTDQTTPQTPTGSFQGDVADIVMAGDQPQAVAVVETNTGKLYTAGYDNDNALSRATDVVDHDEFGEVDGLDGTLSEWMIRGGYDLYFGLTARYDDGRIANAGLGNEGQYGPYSSASSFASPQLLDMPI